MVNPPLNALLKKVDCKYTLAVFAAKRAREITDGDRALVDSHSNKPVTVALEEVAQDKVTYQRIKTGIK
ncbi:DNA-directed RNA polymerase subunit omega [Anaeroselena agilis]|uniref:DNA-directed RNA polymerase subunit omega n=1 Tax=Anaeroselena agilis TaxID=3063788 RepID=A0ABU3NZ19_9FIRM|nr:DNA-directed RNA polymerase subunit omega [Selenomonadales bacterium 4137-cl]